MPHGANHSIPSATLADVLERVRDKGLVIAGDIKIKLVDIESYRFRLVRYDYPRCWSLPPHPLSFIESLRHLPEFMLVRGRFSRPSRQLSMLVRF